MKTNFSGMNIKGKFNLLRNECANFDSRYSMQTHDYRGIEKALTKYAQNLLHEWNPSCKRENNISEGIQVIDFFCGCGGMSLGFTSLSPFFRVIGGCDIDPDAVASYEKNIAKPGVQLDVNTLTNNNTTLNKFLKKLDNFSKKSPLVLIGCAPCQGFTSHRKKHWSKEDYRNSLIVSFASIAVKLNPDCIIMENVPEMLSHKYWAYFMEAKVLLERAGYVVKQNIFNAASFGVPQERFRALVICMKKDFLLPESLIADPKQFVTVRRAIEHLPPIDAGAVYNKDSLHRSANHRRSTLETIRAIPRNGGSRPKGVGPKCLDRVKGFSDVYGRLNWDKPSITITHYARNPASGRYVHPEQDRGLTIREAALLQSFPTNIEFVGSFDSIFKQIGEAVPPMFACAIAAHVLVELISQPPSKEMLNTGIHSLEEPVSSSYSSVIAGIKLNRKK